VSTSLKAVLVTLFVLVLFSLGLNIYIIMQLRNAQLEAQRAAREIGPPLQESLSQTIADLEDFEQSTLEFNIPVEQEFAVEAEIPFDETIEVPIQLTVPISQVVETTILIDPLQTGFEIPVDIAVPIAIEIPIDETLAFPIKRTIPISTTIPLKVDVPIVINVAETDLAQYVTRLREGLQPLSAFLDETLGRLQ
jgi:hypothetical protein